MKNFASILFCSLILISPRFIMGQNEETEFFQTESSAIVVDASADGDGSVSGTRIMAFDSTGGEPMVFADSFGGGLGFSSGFGGSTFSMLNNPSVQKDLQLVDEQLQQIKDINKEFGQRIMEQMNGLKDDKGNLSIGNPQDLSKLIQDLKQQQQAEIENILLPNQQQRLKQVARQMKMKRMGTAGSLTSHLAEELELSEEQKERIKKRADELQAEIAAQMAEMKANAKKEILKELTKDQRSKLEQLVGDEFIVKEEDQKNRFPRFLSRQKSSGKDF